MNFKELKNLLIKNIKASQKVFLLSHNDIDLDGLGAIIGISLICKKYKKNTTFVINDNEYESGVKKALENLKEINIKKKEDINIDEKSLVIIADTNKTNLICLDKELTKENTIIIDHHKKNSNTIKSNKIFIDETSSTCEIVVDLLKSLRIKVPKKYATIILSGIYLDTNDFTIRTSKATFDTASYLLSIGASINDVSYLLKQDIKRYIKTAKILGNIETLKNNIAITTASNKEIYKKEEIASIADTLLDFENINTSFVIGRINEDEISISARSISKLDVGKIMEKLDGGGSKNEAATKLKLKSVKEAEKMLKNILDKE